MKRRSSKRNTRNLNKHWESAGEDAEYPDRCDEIRERLDEIERWPGARMDAGTACHGGRDRHHRQ